MVLSQPTRAAWIEIVLPMAKVATILRRSPLGLRGLKFILFYHVESDMSRSPLGLRGLK